MSFRLFLGLWLVLSALAAGHSFGTDGICYFRMAESLAHHGWFDVPPPEIDPNTGGGSWSPAREYYYAPFTIGHPLMLLPWYLLGRVLAIGMQVNYSESFVVSFSGAFATALTWTLFFTILFRHGIRRHTALIGTLAGLFGSIAFPYARYDYSEPTLGLWFVLIWLQLTEWRRQVTSSRAMLLPIAVTVWLALLTRPAAIAILPGIAAWIWASARGFTGNERSAWRPLAAAIGIGVLLGAASQAGFNAVRFGQLFSTGYELDPDGTARGFTTPPWYGLAILLLSPGKSLWVFAPLLLLSAAAWRRCRDADGPAAFLVAGAALGHLALYCVWSQPEGGYTWGPRFFVPILPMMLFPAIWWLDRVSRPVPFRLLAIAGICVQLLGIGVNFSAVVREQDPPPDVPSANRYYNPANGMYNMWFQPFGPHLRHLTRYLASPASWVRLRSPGDRLASYQSAVVNAPLWMDAPDFWPLHLTRDGFPPAAVWLAWLAMAVPGGWLLIRVGRESANAVED